MAGACRPSRHAIVWHERDRAWHEPERARGYLNNVVRLHMSNEEAAVNGAWEKIDAWAEHFAPLVSCDLLPPADEERIGQAERSLGHTFPVAFRRSLGRHEGQTGESGALLGGFTLIRLSEIVETHSMLARLRRSGAIPRQLDDKVGADPGVQQSWWCEGWLPIASDGAGNHICVDVAPTAIGVAGQLITYYRDHPLRRLVAPSFAALLTRAARWMESGRVLVERTSHPPFEAEFLEYLDWDEFIAGASD